MTGKLNCYIVDDEHLARRILEEYAAKVSFLAVKGSFSSALQAAEKLPEDSPDLLLLDVNMPDLNGISFISMLNPKPAIILTTAYDEYALKAFDLDVKDYLLKPISFDRFYRGVLRVYQDVNRGHSTEEASAPAPTDRYAAEYLFLKVGFRIQKIEVGEILFVEGMKDYLCIHTVREKFMTLTSFAKLVDLLPPKRFARVHRSYLVALDKIEYIEKNTVRIADRSMRIGSTYADEFYRMLNDSGE